MMSRAKETSTTPSMSFSSARKFLICPPPTLMIADVNFSHVNVTFSSFRTFRKNHEMSNQYIVANFGRILGYSQEQSLDATTFARHQGFSNLGTWTRDECLNIGNQLRFQGFECRIVPVTSDDEDEELGNGFDDWATEEWGSETVAHC